MFKNYLTIAWRNLVKNKIFSLINILGLTIGITCCMLIFLYINNEFSVDGFHAKRNDIYRVMRGFDVEKTVQRTPYTSGPYATALLNDYPDQIRSAVRVMPNNGLVSIGDRSFNERKIYHADAGFFELFSFPLLRGNAHTALAGPSGVVITEATAKKYFGKEDAMGKTIELNKKTQLTVTGVCANVPANSHLDFDLVMPISMYAGEPWFSVWINNSMFTYVELAPGVKAGVLQANFVRFMDKYMGKDMERMQAKFDLTLTPMNDIYFEPYTAFDNVRHGDKKVVYIFLSIAVLILLIACINFMNLSTIRAVERSKEVGLRKVMGALRNHLVWQFIGESVLLTFLACALSIGLLQLLMPLYNQLLGYSLTVSWNKPQVYFFLGAIILLIGFLAGCYPAFVLSSFSPIQALKGKLKLGKGGALFRQGLVVVQFSISVLLIIGTIIIVKQMRYMKNKELGYNKEQVITVPIDNDAIDQGSVLFKNQLQADPAIRAVSLLSGEPGGFFDMHTFKVEGSNDRPWKFRTEFADFEMIKTLGLKIIAGRELSSEYATDSMQAVLVNRTCAAQLGFTPAQAIGKWLQNSTRDPERRTIVGVVEDFNFLSLKEQMEPLVISPSIDRRMVAIKFSGADPAQGIAAVRKAYAAVAPDYPLEYNFLDRKFDVLYQADVRQQKILTIFSGLAIFIACLGLFGLASFTTAKRTREIGVRKVLGSSAGNIVVLLSGDLLKPILLATVIAIPAGYYFMSNWLNNFAYRTGMDWWIFALAAGVTILIALFTVGFKAVRAAMVNPVRSLRAE